MDYSVFEYTYLLFWNIFWTLLPVIALGLFDRDIGQSQVYGSSSVGKLPNSREFPLQMATA